MVTDYKNVIKNFTALSKVPRGSGFNGKINAFLMDFAKEHGLEATSDAALNVVIKKPATKGYENAAPVVLQGHMDMVCVTDPGVEHNFENEGLELEFDGDFVTANGTTLGGDDGIALAYMMSLLEDEELEHPALICVMTTDEETGMDGAKALDPACFAGAKYLINLDSETENECLCGCAGGLRIDGRLPIDRVRRSGTAYKLTLTGLRGGHSGAQIHLNITNAVRLLGRILFELKQKSGLELINAKGGEKDNAIPSSASAELLLDAGDKAALEEIIKDITAKYKKREPNLKIELEEEGEKECFILTGKSLGRLTFLLLSVPDGMQKMSPEMEDLVETSLNLGIFETVDKEARLHYSLRSSVIGEKEFLSSRVRMILDSQGAKGTENSEYPAWEYNSASVLRDKYKETFEKITGTAPKITVIHAGVECGLFAKKCPDLDMISIGPDMKDIHTPAERLDLASSVRLYRVVEALLPELR